MDRSQWQLVKAVYDFASSKTSPITEEDLIQQCGGDADVCREVQSMLGNRRRADEFFHQAAGDLRSFCVPIVAAGTVLADRFRVRQFLGAGGMGQVYAVEDQLALGRPIALKTLPSVRSDALRLFKNEFRSLAGFLHPNLITLFEMIAHEDLWCFTMELVDGDDLIEYLRPRQRAMDAGHLERIFSQIVAGLAALHQAGKTHCDLKPTNLLVRDDGRVVILDFGLVQDIRRASWERSTSVVAGTLSYMSPEQASGQPPSASSDWYALGVLLYQVLTGCLPFRGTAEELLEQKRCGPQEAPKTLNPATPDSLNELCLGLLKPRIESRPDAVEIARLLGSLNGAAPRRESERRRFVGRQSELRELRQAHAALLDGVSSVWLIEGVSGIGKTALIESFLESVDVAPGTLVFRGKCYEQENVPYKALDAVIDGIGGYLRTLPESIRTTIFTEETRGAAHLFPTLKEFVADPMVRDVPEIDATEQRKQAGTALKALITNLGRHRNLVFFIDDLHWGDLDSGVLLAEILSGPEPPRLLLMAALRKDEGQASPCRERLFRSPSPSGISQILLEPLLPFESRELAAQLAGAFASSVEQIVNESGGNPFFIEQIAQTFQEEPRAGGTVDHDIDMLVRRSVNSMPDPAQRLLEAVALSGRPITYANACAAAQIDGSDPKIMLSLRFAHLARTVSSGPRARIDTYHDRVRERVIQSIPPARAVSGHLRLGEVMLESGEGEQETIAYHLELGGEGARAGMLYLKAARAADDALAFDAAARCYSKSLQFAKLEKPARLDVLVQLATAQGNSGSCYQAAKTYQRALEEAPAENSHQLQRSAAYNLCISGHVDEGRLAYVKFLIDLNMRLPKSAFSGALRILKARGTLSVRGLALRPAPSSRSSELDRKRVEAAWSVATGLGMIDVASGAVFATESLVFALRTGDPSLVARSLLWEAVIRGVTQGENKQAREFLQIALSYAAPLPDPRLKGMSHLALGFHAFQRYRFAEAKNYFETAETIFRERCRGAIWEISTAQHQWVHTCLVMGEYALVAGRLPLLLREAQDRGDLYSSTTLGVFSEVMNRLREDQPEVARDILDRSLAEWPEDVMSFQRTQAMLGASWIHLYLKQPRQAEELLERKWPELKRSGVLRSEIHRITLLDMRCRAALAAAACDEPGGAFLSKARGFLKLLRKETSPMARAMRTLGQASLQALIGQHAAAAKGFSDARDAFRRLDMSAFAWSAHRAAGILQNDETMISDAHQWLRTQGVLNTAQMADACVPLPFKDRRI